MGKKKPNTPRSLIKHALDRMWMCSRERGAALKKTGYTCTDCGAKQSKAKGREVKLEVHHDPPKDRTAIIDMLVEFLKSPQLPLCKDCHKKRHEETH